MGAFVHLFRTFFVFPLLMRVILELLIEVIEQKNVKILLLEAYQIVDENKRRAMEV